MSAVEKILKKYIARLDEESDKRALYNREKKRRGDDEALGKTPKDVEAELEKELGAYVGKWKKTQAEKAKKNKEQSSGDDEHAPSYGDLCAVLWRNGKYNT